MKTLDTYISTNGFENWFDQGLAESVASFVPGRRAYKPLELRDLFVRHLRPTHDESELDEHLITHATPDIELKRQPVIRPQQTRPALLIPSTPRSGNTILSVILGEVLGLPRVSAHALRHLDIAQYRSGLIMQIHRSADRVGRRDKRYFRPIIIIRNPLDTVMSLYRFTRREPQTLYFYTETLGLRISRASLMSQLGDGPTSDEFVRWATSPEVVDLLSINRTWKSDPRAIFISYEELLDRPAPTVRNLLEEADIADEVRVDIGPAVTRQLDVGLKGTSNQHRWQSAANGWKKFLTGDVATRIHKAHRASFDAFGFEFSEPEDGFLSPQEAVQNWMRES